VQIRDNLDRPTKLFFNRPVKAPAKIPGAPACAGIDY
jgi:hypothetical protein